MPASRGTLAPPFSAARVRITHSSPTRRTLYRATAVIHRRAFGPIPTTCNHMQGPLAPGAATALPPSPTYRPRRARRGRARRARRRRRRRRRREQRHSLMCRRHGRAGHPRLGVGHSRPKTMVALPAAPRRGRPAALDPRHSRCPPPHKAALPRRALLLHLFLLLRLQRRRCWPPSPRSPPPQPPSHAARQRVRPARRAS